MRRNCQYEGLRLVLAPPSDKAKRPGRLELRELGERVSGGQIPSHHQRSGLRASGT